MKFIALLTLNYKTVYLGFNFEYTFDKALNPWTTNIKKMPCLILAVCLRVMPR